MDMVKEYDVIKSAKIEEIVSAVQAKLTEGWTVIQGITTQVQPAPGGGGYITYLQTIVKY